MAEIPKEGVIEIQIDEQRPPLKVNVIEPGRIMVVENLFSESECRQIIEQSERIEFEPLPTRIHAYRNNDRFMIDSTEQLQAIIYERLRQGAVVPDVLQIDNRCALSDWGLIHQTGARAPDAAGQVDFDQLPQHADVGEWRIDGLNPRMRFCRYEKGGHFAPHYDGVYVADMYRRSFYTVNIYLNEEFQGGNTNFLAAHYKTLDERVITEAVVPRTGLALVFWHPILHEGDQVISGTKYIMRTDVVYRKCNVEMSTNDQQALATYRLAEQREAEGKSTEAAELYRRAFKLSPNLEEALYTR